MFNAKHSIIQPGDFFTKQNGVISKVSAAELAPFCRELIASVPQYDINGNFNEDWGKGLIVLRNSEKRFYRNYGQTLCFRSDNLARVASGT